MTDRDLRLLLICDLTFRLDPPQSSLADCIPLVQSTGVALDDYRPFLGSLFYHEMTHWILGTEDYNYEAPACLSLPNHLKIRNAQNWLFVSLAFLLEKNAWVKGFAQPVDNYGDTGPRSESQPFIPSIQTHRNLPRLAEIPSISENQAVTVTEYKIDAAACTPAIPSRPYGQAGLVYTVVMESDIARAGLSLPPLERQTAVTVESKLNALKTTATPSPV